MSSRGSDNDLRKSRLARIRKRKLSERRDKDTGDERPSRQEGSPRKERRRVKQNLKRKAPFGARMDGSRLPFAERFREKRQQIQGDRPESPGDGTILDAIRDRMRQRMEERGFQRPQPPVGPDRQPVPPAARSRGELQAQMQQMHQQNPMLQQAQGMVDQMGQQPQPSNRGEVNAYDAEPVYAPQPALQPGQPVYTGQPGMDQALQHLQHGQQPQQPQLLPAPQPGLPGGPQLPAHGAQPQAMPARRKPRILPDGRIVEEEEPIVGGPDPARLG